MLDDRDYMRQPADNGPSFLNWLKLPAWSWTLAIVVINVIAFFLECAFSSHPLSLAPNNPFFNQYLALSLDGIKHGCVWQLVTYQFMHGGFFHIFFNCWMIFIFGSMLEELLGGGTFLILYLSSGVVGGLCQILAAQFWPQWFDGPVVGASAGAFGLVAAFATLFPNYELELLLFFFIPTKLKAKTLLILSAILALVGLRFPDSVFIGSILGAHVANAAHLGGMLAGVVFVLTALRGREFPDPSVDPQADPILAAPPAPAAPSSFWRAKTVRADAELSAEELLKTQVDPILDKISAHGLQSLTTREREILKRASGQLAKR